MEAEDIQKVKQIISSLQDIFEKYNHEDKQKNSIFSNQLQAQLQQQPVQLQQPQLNNQLQQHQAQLQQPQQSNLHQPQLNNQFQQQPQLQQPQQFQLQQSQPAQLQQPQQQPVQLQQSQPVPQQQQPQQFTQQKSVFSTSNVQQIPTVSNLPQPTSNQTMSQSSNSEPVSQPCFASPNLFIPSDRQVHFGQDQHKMENSMTHQFSRHHEQEPDDDEENEYPRNQRSKGFHRRQEYQNDDGSGDEGFQERPYRRKEYENEYESEPKKFGKVNGKITRNQFAPYPKATRKPFY